MKQGNASEMEQMTTQLHLEHIFNLHDIVANIAVVRWDESFRCWPSFFRHSSRHIRMLEEKGEKDKEDIG